MIDLTDLRRIRLHGGTRVHSVGPSRERRYTDCGKWIKLLGPTGKTYDHALPPQQAVTCPKCARAITAHYEETDQ